MKKTLIVLFTFHIISAIANDFIPLNHNQITLSELNNMLPDEFENTFTQPYIYYFSWYSDTYIDNGEVEFKMFDISLYLNQAPKKVIGRESPGGMAGAEINNAPLNEDCQWTEISNYCQSTILKLISTIYPHGSKGDEDIGSGSCWVGCSASLGSYLEYELQMGEMYQFDVNAYAVKTSSDLYSVSFGYNPITSNQLYQLLINDNAGAYFGNFTQPFVVRFELESGADIDRAVKMVMHLSEAPQWAIGRGSGENNHQAAIGDAINNLHNIKTYGFENIFQWCYTKNLYMILNDDPNTKAPGTMVLWMGFNSDIGHSLSYESLSGWLPPESFSITSFRITDKAVNGISLQYPNYEMAFLQQGDNYYIDRSYYLAYIPETLKGLLWIKTANSDKRINTTSYLSFNLEKAATVYIAYDQRATSVPNWLSQQFEKTALNIQVSDKSGLLTVWKKDAPEGTFTLGGNLAPGAEGAKSNYVVLLDIEDDIPPVACFSAEPTTGNNPLSVQFTNCSTGEITSYNWNFGDGTSSSVQNPSHTYATAGHFSVSLTVTGPGGSNTSTREDYILVQEDMLIADFQADITQGNSPLTVNFTDFSQGYITTWLWNFGDGTISTSQNPIHTFESADTFTVALTVSGPTGINTKVRPDYISVLGPTGIEYFTNNGIPNKFKLYSNYPNPFNPSTTVRYDLPSSCYFELSVYNINGVQVADVYSGKMPAGSYTTTWDASGLPSGLYFIKLQANQYTQIRKCLLVK